MKYISLIINSVFPDWKKEYLKKSENAEDFEIRQKYIEKYEKTQREIKLNILRM